MITAAVFNLTDTFLCTNTVIHFLSCYLCQMKPTVEERHED